MSDPAKVDERPSPSTARETQIKSRCEVFQTRMSVFVFTFYVSLCSTQYVLVKASQTSDDYTYNTTSVVFITEAFKLLIAAAAFCIQNRGSCSLIDIAISRWRLLLLYFIPSVLYCMSNNLVFINLRYFEPTTYNVLQQLKIVLTGILYQTVLRKKLSPKQWFAIILLALGCAMKQFGATQKSLAGFHNIFNLHGLLLFFQIGCTSLSGVFNEHLIKTDSRENSDTQESVKETPEIQDLDIMVHNVFMYLDSVVCNFLVLVCRGKSHDLIDFRELSNIFGQPLVLAVVVNGAASGIMVSLFLKHFDSIVRVFTGSMEMALMAIVCRLTFATPIDSWTVIAIIVVSLATYLYAKEINHSGSKTNSAEDAAKYEEIQIITRL